MKVLFFILNLSQIEIEESRYHEKESTKSEIVKGCLSDRASDIFPPAKWVPNYKMNFLTGDIISGITVSMIRLPQGLAYGLLAGLAPINGIYLEFFQCIMYSFLSTVPQNSVGTFSVISLMVGSVLDKHFPTPQNMTDDMLKNGITDYDAKLEMAVSLSFMVGLFQIAFGILNLGCLSILLAKPVVSGFTTASAIVVALAQGTHLFGVPVTRYSGFAGPLKTFGSIIYGILQGVNTSAVIISCVSIPFLYGSKLLQIKYKDRLKGFPIPAELFLIIVTTTVCYFLPKPNKVIIVGEVPGGLPKPFLPPFLTMFSDIFADALVISIVSYSTTLSLGKIFAGRKKFKWSANQEGFALGVAHIFSSFFSCFPGSAALARSSLQESAGGNTHLASIISASVMLLIILWIGPIFKTLPRSVLSCIVIVNLRGMFLQFYELPNLWKVSKIDFIIWLASFCGVLVFGVDLGLLFGIVVLLIGLVYTNSSSILHPIQQYKSSEVYFHQKCKSSGDIYKFSGPLNFVSAGNLKLEGTECVIDFSTVTSIDYVGVNTLLTQAKGRNVSIIGVYPEVRRKLEADKQFESLEIHFYPTILDIKQAL